MYGASWSSPRTGESPIFERTTTPTRRSRLRGRSRATEDPAHETADLTSPGEVSSEQLVLAAEHVAHRPVGEDLTDRVGEQVRGREHLDVVWRARSQRDRVGDDDLLEVRGS